MCRRCLLHRSRQVFASSDASKLQRSWVSWAVPAVFPTLSVLGLWSRVPRPIRHARTGRAVWTGCLGKSKSSLVSLWSREHRSLHRCCVILQGSNISSFCHAMPCHAQPSPREECGRRAPIEEVWLIPSCCPHDGPLLRARCSYPACHVCHVPCAVRRLHRHAPFDVCHALAR
ncbi:hypothetical protein F5Y18DRAFT_27470 [Xylariaceae sp. FL1019]|nr:hypothetical protein F5Y18DRAFT_27470 [Xylariaceae sp. FL1019]